MTVAFVAAMALVLLAVGWLIYVRYRSELNASIDRGLRSRAGDVATLVRVDRRGTTLPIRKESLGEDNFAQVLTPSGRVLDAIPRPTRASVLTASELRDASPGPLFVERPRVEGIDGPARLIATSVQPKGRPLVVVVATALDDRNTSLATLLRLLVLGGAAALLLGSLAGYAAVAASLRPVEAIRRQAAAISAADPARRLPVSPARDELRRLGETLNAMLARLELALERERAFVDDASHELRTPLAMQKAELEVALRHSDDVEELRAAIASSIDEVDRLSQLAEDLLVLARSDKGRLAVKVERVDVGSLLASTGDRFRGRASAAGRTLEVTPSDGHSVDADRLRLEQALGNLVDNALRHGAGPIRIWSRSGDSRIELHVSDAGRGFPSQFLPHAFERFARADASRSGEGSGLGLAIVEAIARAHGGSAAASNREAAGADVWMVLPTRDG